MSILSVMTNSVPGFFVFCFHFSFDENHLFYIRLHSEFLSIGVPVLVSVRPALISHTVRIESLSTLDTIFHESIRSLNTGCVLETSSQELQLSLPLM